jgi:glucose/arabinose dehydrogenase
MNRAAFAALCALTCLAACTRGPEVSSEETSPSQSGPQELTLPSGFAATVVSPGLGEGARQIAVDDNGDIYVKMAKAKEHGGIIALRDTDGDGRADVRESFGDFDGGGLALHAGFLYASSDVAVYRFTLDPASLVPPAGPEMIVSGFPDQSEHAFKTFTLDGQGHLYVNVGAPSNACMEKHRTPGSKGMDPCPQLERHAGVWRFRDDQPGQTQEEGKHYSTGSRNMVALEWNTEVDSLYGVQHGRDQLSMFWPELFEDEQSAELPAEEFLQIAEGDDFGWPYCYYDQIQDKKVLAPEYGGDGKTEGRCAEKKDPILTFPGHLAPNDLVFYTGDQFPAGYRGGAFIAFHGSWNRAPLPQKGFFVVFVPFEDGQPLGEWEVFADGFSGRAEVAEPGDAAHRPCGLAVGPDGSLYVADSVQGTIWRIAYTG